MCTTIWMNLKSIMISERSQAQKDTHCKIPFWKRQNREDRNQVSGCPWQGWGDAGHYRTRGKCWDEHILYFDYNGGYILVFVIELYI